MLVYRYLSRQLFASTLAVAFVLVLVLVFGRFIKYLGDAAEGRIQAEVLWGLLIFRLPGFLELILPMSLFMGILLAYGRMYVDSEMVVLRAAGVSNMQLVRMCGVPALMMAAVVASFSVALSPWGYATVQQIFKEQRARPEIDMLSAGRFYKRSADGVERATYAEKIVDGRTRLENAFFPNFRLALRTQIGSPASSRLPPGGAYRTTTATSISNSPADFATRASLAALITMWLLSRPIGCALRKTRCG